MFNHVLIGGALSALSTLDVSLSAEYDHRHSQSLDALSEVTSIISNITACFPNLKNQFCYCVFNSNYAAVLHLPDFC